MSEGDRPREEARDADAGSGVGVPGPLAPTTFSVPYASEGRVHALLPGRAAPGPRPWVLAVHGYAEPVETLLAYARRLVPDAVVLAPEGPSAFRRRREPGVRRAWIADPDRAAEDRRNTAFLHAVVDEAAASLPVDRERGFLLGYSQGVGVGLHAWLERPDLFRAGVGLAGGLARPYRGRLRVLAGRDLLWVTGRRDHGYPPDYTAELLRSFTASGLVVRSNVLEEGHDLLEAAFDSVRSWFAPRIQA